MTKRFSLAVNYISLTGIGLILLCLANMFFLLLIDIASGSQNPYYGVISFLVLPIFIALGGVLVAIGMVRESIRRRKLPPGQPVETPAILAKLKTSRPLVGFLLFMSSVGFLLLSSAGSYRAYKFTESEHFCGQVCHAMQPEYNAYKVSPHARVECAECHVGPGASWYIRSKMSGMRQVYASIFDDFERPIPSPVENLRPAQQTCERCHWPEKFFDAKLKVFNHFGYDEKNTPNQIRMLVKIGGGSPTTGMTSGIHWHMNVNNEVSYFDKGGQRQDIPYIRVKDAQGRIIEYTAKDSKPEEFSNSPLRKMDCIDCHNRPTHIFQPPDRAIDDLLMTKTMDASLPFIKQYAVEAITKDYKTTREGLEGIATFIGSTYETKHPEVFKEKGAAIKQAVTDIQQVFRINIVPEMKLNWEKHPDNIGHLYSSGCFRCHDGLHVSKEGRTISRDCESCHTILDQTNSLPKMPDVKPGVFQHPGGEMDFSEFNCNSCHTGGKQ